MKNTTHSIIAFIAKSLAMTLPVMIPALIYYFVADPFKTVKNYDPYFSDPKATPIRLGVNKGMVSVRNLTTRQAEGIQYNAFIFGSSVSCYYDADEWASYLGEDAIPYHFDSSSESLMSMADKVCYLDRQGTEIRYALIVLDPLVISANDSDKVPFINPPDLYNSINYLAKWLHWHYIFFTASTNVDYLKTWIPWKLTGEKSVYGNNTIFEEQPIEYNAITNQENMPMWDSIIANNPEQFYSIYPLIPSPDSITACPVNIDSQRTEALQTIASIFAKHHTDYQIIIGPKRSKHYLNPVDYETLTSIFDSSRVHDYSRELAPDLESDTLMYDNTHYRPVYASRLMKKCYTNYNNNFSK